ncbi:MAG: hypothetical protein H0X24_02760 [Ktedonobacterales bacterium]|nr:hypothetical protein [Ktedonobacterales bacterium]
MSRQPLLHLLCIPLCLHIYDAVGFQVDENAAETPPPPPTPIIDADHLYGRLLRLSG